ncbi:MAG: AAA family ATPase [Bacilli bacterium]|nr:AAA family ATPase [Bacilli bacterium]
MITKISIKNFGSIKDTEIIKFNKDITAFIGKNESGKSTILRAINKLNNGKIIESDKNVLLRNNDSFIEATFRLEKDDIDKINLYYEDNTKYKFYKLPTEYDALYFTKRIDDSGKILHKLFYLNYDEKTKNNVEIQINKIFSDKIRNIINDIFNNNKNDKIESFLNDIKDMSEGDIKDHLQTLIIEDENIKQEINDIVVEIKPDSWIELLPKYKFIYFSSFKDVLNDNVLFEMINNNQQALNILNIANIDMNKLKKAFEENDEITLGDMETDYLEIVSKKFKDIFQQTDENFKLKIRFGTNKKEIIFLTQDKTSDTKSINLSQRSDGFKWYLSLYLTLYDYLEKKAEDINYVLLLDEPNLYLHPGAQKNLLNNVFYKDFSNLQIFYTTHSPYMIDIDNNFSLRIVEKNESTKVYNSTREYAEKHADMKDIDTMTPLLTALDLNISNDIIYESKDKIFVVEGIQDVYLLRAMVNKLKYNTKMKNIKFISGTSAEKVPITYSYLFGMGYNTFTLVDKDKSGLNANRLIAEGSIDEELSYNLLNYDVINDYNSKTFMLESLMSEEDLKKYIPEKNTIYYKRIYDNFENMTFSKETIDNFKDLFDILLKK